MKQLSNICAILLCLSTSGWAHSLEYICTYENSALGLKSTMTFSEATEHRSASFGFIGSDFSMFMLASPDFTLEIADGEFRLHGALNKATTEAFRAVIPVADRETKKVRAQIWLKASQSPWPVRPNYIYMCEVGSAT